MRCKIAGKQLQLFYKDMFMVAISKLKKSLYDSQSLNCYFCIVYSFPYSLNTSKEKTFEVNIYLIASSIYQFIIN